MTFQEALKFLDSFINYEKSPSYNYKESIKLERMQELLNLLGQPQKGIKALHIAGTKGKGSTASVVSSILEKAGYKTGLYTSPHLVSFQERIKINGLDISEDSIISIIELLKPALACMETKGCTPSFFEIYTALAFMHFNINKVDFMVLETGLGGRLDATNTADSLISGITQISYEHMDKLGSTLSEIAFEKAGIIKNNSFVVSSGQEPEADNIIEKEAERKKSTLFKVGRDIFYKGKNFDLTGQRFNVKGISGEYKNLKTPFLGDHQLMNISTAIGMVESLKFYSVKINKDAIEKGIISAKWPGRLQIASRDPLIVLDGAQNRASAKALKESVKKYFKFSKLILILGVSKDKDIAGISDEIIDLADRVILTEANLSRAMEVDVLKKYFDSKKPILTKSVPEAIVKAFGICEKKDLILITGSLFVVGEAKGILN